MDLLVDSKEAVTLVGGGPVAAKQLDLAVKLAPMVIAADSGINRAHAHNQMVHHVIGDMDSVDLLPIGDEPEIHPISEQMSTDLDKCLYSTNAPFYLGVGFLGGRLDHQMAACHSLLKATDKNVMLLGERDICFLAPQKLEMTLPVGTRLSLFPMAEVTGKSIGLKWPINKYRFAPDVMIGTSNEVTKENIRLEFDQRKMLLILPVRFLETALEQVF